MVATPEPEPPASQGPSEADEKKRALRASQEALEAARRTAPTWPAPAGPDEARGSAAAAAPGRLARDRDVELDELE